MEELKSRFLPHHPDDPVILHREEIINARKDFKVLRDPAIRAEWDRQLLQLCAAAEFRVVAVVIDKLALREDYGDTAAHPYHLGLGFMLQRFAGYLNHINRVGDVIAESRGGREDGLLKDSFSHVFDRGVWMTPAQTFQEALTSSQLKLKVKSANISGLQLADLLGHPVKQWILIHNGLIKEHTSAFARELMEIVQRKFNCHLYKKIIEGYGYVIFPSPKK